MTRSCGFTVIVVQQSTQPLTPLYASSRFRFRFHPTFSSPFDNQCLHFGRRSRSSRHPGPAPIVFLPDQLSVPGQQGFRRDNSE